jgi:HAD superfamily hydrolase (TIGR01490 family)
VGAFRRKADDRVAAVVAGAAAAAAAEVEPAPDAPTAAPDPSAAAFFDVDNTIMVGASIYYFAKGLVARKVITNRDLWTFAYDQVRFRISGAESHAAMAKVRESALAFVAGKSVDDIVCYGEEIYDEMMAERIYPGTRALAQQHLDAGQRVWLVTATPVELANIIAQRLGFTGALGTVSEVENGCYTGRLVGEPLHGPAKAEAILALAEREGLDLERCTAYSDSRNDVPMLSCVGTAVAINADADLRAVAKENGWEVRDFRTGRTAIKIGVPAAAGLGAVTGGVFAGLAYRKRRFLV